MQPLSKNIVIALAEKNVREMKRIDPSEFNSIITDCEIQTTPTLVNALIKAFEQYHRKPTRANTYTLSVIIFVLAQRTDPLALEHLQMLTEVSDGFADMGVTSEVLENITKDEKEIDPNLN